MGSLFLARDIEMARTALTEVSLTFKILETSQDPPEPRKIQSSSNFPRKLIKRVTKNWLSGSPSKRLKSNPTSDFLTRT